MIPKIIHYCWFGKKKKPKLVMKCIRSWQKHCPDYKFIEWNEENFDIEINNYVKEAYENKKYAFVTDFVRLYVMYTYGGIYMDTDVEIIKPLDGFLNNHGFSGFESEKNIPTGIMAGEKGFKLYKELLLYYDNRNFVLKDGMLDMTTNVFIITNTLLKKGFIPNGQFQIIDGMALYPQDYFCPFSNETGVLSRTNNTVAIHWFNKSWIPTGIRIRSKITRPIHRVFGVNFFSFLKK